MADRDKLIALLLDLDIVEDVGAAADHLIMNGVTAKESVEDDEDWFGVVRWCDEDIKETLEQGGYSLSQENITTVRNVLGSDFREAMIQAGWEHINYVVDNLEDKLTKEE